METKIEFERRVYLFACKHGLTLDWQNMQFGYRRARLQCKNDMEFQTIWNLARKIKNIRVDTWVCCEGEFEGYVYLMYEADWCEMQRKQEDERARLEDWWQRYHVADPGTKSLMACGAIE